MSRPYIICHMMTSIDGRIDCAMTEQLKGVEDYDRTLAELNADATLCGRRTAELEMSLPGRYICNTSEKIGHEGFYRSIEARGYEVIVDTAGVLRWEDAAGMDKPYLIITSENAATEYLSYLESRHISWIAVGKERVDLARAVELLREKFGVERLAVVGGAQINTAFLEAGLVDEVSVLIGVGIDGRGGFAPLFDGRGKDAPVIPLTTERVEVCISGAIWVRYRV